MLWSPENPALYNLIVRIRDEKVNPIDGYRRRIGIRSIEFKGEDGFWLNEMCIRDSCSPTQPE